MSIELLPGYESNHCDVTSPNLLYQWLSETRCYRGEGSKEVFSAVVQGELEEGAISERAQRRW